MINAGFFCFYRQAMSILCISQARMTSTRLPGKVLKSVMGRILLDYHVSRLKQSKHIDHLIIATTTNDTDDPIAAFCEEQGVECFRGCEDDVLSRYIGAAKAHNPDIVIRVTSDCPLIDPNIIDQVIEYYQNSDSDYVNLDGEAYPRGLDVEVFSYDALKQADEQGKETYHREHVTPYIYLNPDQFKCGTYSQGGQGSDYRWCVDEPADFELIKKMLTALNGRDGFSWTECVDLMAQNPDWTKINSNVHQKSLDE